MITHCHAWVLNLAITSGQSRTSRRYLRLNRSRKNDAQTGISSVRCLSGGIQISTALRRFSSWERWSLLSPPCTVDAMTRTSTRMISQPPVRETSPVCSVWSLWHKGARQGPDLLQVPVVRGTSVPGSGTVTTSLARSGNVVAAAGAMATTVTSTLLRTGHGESCNGIGDARLVLIGG